VNGRLSNGRTAPTESERANGSTGGLMGTLSQFVVRVANLAEAEGRVARRSAAEFSVVVCVYLGATLLAVGCIVALSAAVFHGLVEGLGLSRGWAYLVSAAILGATAAICVVVGNYMRDNWRPGR